MKIKIHPYVLVVSVLIAMILLTAAGGIIQHEKELQNNSEIPAAEILQKHSGQKTPANHASVKKSPPAGDTPVDSYGQAGSTAINSGNVPAAGNSSPAYGGSAKSVKKISYVTVYLSVNGAYKGGVRLKSTANQCEVLHRARVDGAISSLETRYHPQYGTEGVYVIDGIGDSNSVWWTYKVNGKSPPYGCSYMPVHSGDSVNWQYIKS